MCKLFYPPCGVGIDTHTDLQARFIDTVRKEGIAAALDFLLPQKGEAELTHPRSVRFAWEAGDAPYLFELSEDEAFSAPFTVSTAEPCLEFSGFKVGQRYFWRVNGGESFFFQTKDSRFRFIEMEGALNVRDLGGIHIRQGLIYRGSEIDREYKITERGKRVWKDQLGIKTELNLRKETAAEGACCCVDGVRYKYLPYRPYSEVFEEEHRRGIVAIMEFLADEDNYPIYFHCLGGADRTGMIALFLRALLGEDEEDILIDYELTSLSSYAHGLAEGVAGLGFRSRETEYFRGFLERFYRENEGKTLGEKTESFLLSCGVKREILANIRSILAK